MNTTRILFWFCDVLRRENTPSQVAGGVAMGFLLGFTPWLTLQALIYFTIAYSLRVNLGSLLLSVGFFSALSQGLQSPLHLFGQWLLADVSALSGLWTLMYHSPLLPLTRFNHTSVMGGLAFSGVFVLPLYWLTKLTHIVAGESIARTLKETIHSFSSGTSRLLRTYAQHQRQNPT